MAAGSVGKLNKVLPSNGSVLWRKPMELSNRAISGWRLALSWAVTKLL